MLRFLYLSIILLLLELKILDPTGGVSSHWRNYILIINNTQSIIP